MNCLRPKEIISLLAIITGFLLFSAFEANAATLNVPRDYPTIQAGIDASQDGDTVLVDPGIYVECINFLDKGITVASSAGPEVTVIDASRQGTVVTITTLLGQQVKQCSLQGFTLRNGAPSCSYGNCAPATAILIEGSSPIITGNIIDGNSDLYEAVYTDGSPIIEKNIFLNFSCNEDPASAVVVIQPCLSTSAIVRNNLFFNNPCRAISFTGEDGGQAQVANNTIVGNKGGIAISTMFLYGCPLKNNIIVRNEKAFEIQGGFIRGFVWENNLVYGNDIDYSGVSDQTGTYGNISADPLFLDPAGDDYHLCPGSPAIEMGDPSGIQLAATDLDGNPRVINGKVDIGAYEFDPDKPFIMHTIKASAGPGGAITPQGSNKALDGTTKIYFIAPNPNYQVSALYVDGVNVISASVTPLSYSFGNINADHTITAEFGHYFDYFGMQAGNHLESLATYANGSTQTETDDISVADPYLLDKGATGNDLLDTWFQSLSSGLFMKKQQDSSGDTITYSPALPLIETPLKAGARWAASSNITVNGAQGTARVTATVSPMVLVSVSAGHFLAWPVKYILSASGQGGTSLTSFTYWFAPHIGNVRSVDPNSTTTLTTFAVGGGTVTIPPPIVTATVPTSGMPGSPVTINGFQFGASRGTSKVMIGNTQCPVTSWSDTQIQCTVPQAAISGAVTVITDTWTSNATVKFAVVPPLVVTGVSPASGIRGTKVTITGSSFGASEGASKVMIGSVQCPVGSWSDTQIVCTVPATAVSGAVTVVTAGRTSNATVDFTVVLPPTVTGVSPTSAVCGSQITINGSWFGASQGTGKVRIGSVLCSQILSWSGTQIVCTVPATAVSGAVTVVTIAGTSNATVKLTVMLPPVVTGVVPAAGVRGSQVTINGARFGASQGSSQVSIGNVPCYQIISWSGTQIKCTVPDTAVSGAVTVITIAGTSNGTVKFTVKIPPKITGVIPSTGQRGTSVQIAGINFGTVQGHVKLGSVPKGIAGWALTSITFTVPAAILHGPYPFIVVNSQRPSGLQGAFSVVL
jgi:hypothetical protein